MSTALLAYHEEERRLLDLIDYRDTIADKSSLAWAEADTAIGQYLANLPLERRVDRLNRTISFLDAQDRAAKAEIDRLRAWQSKSRDAVATLKARAQDFMVTTGQTRIEGFLTTLRLTPNPPKVVVHDEALVPNEYKEITVTLLYSNWLNIVDHVPALVGAFLNITKPEPRKSLIKIALDGGEGVPGCAIEQEFRVDSK